jgi:hypothetical protein
MSSRSDRAGARYVYRVNRRLAALALVTLAVTASADIALVGQIWRGGDLGGGPPTVEGAIDVLVAKLDRDLGHRWSMAFGDLGIVQSATAVGLGVDGMIAFGDQNVTTLDLGGQPLSSSTQDLFLARFFP